MKMFARGRLLGLTALFLVSGAVAAGVFAGTAPARVGNSGLNLWSVVGDGGNSGKSATYSLSWTTGQIATGKGSAGSLELNRGFWQNFNTSCCIGRRGNINLAGIVDVSDLCALVSFLTTGSSLTCYEAANVSGTGIVDLADLSALANYLTSGGYVLPYCP
ncbi:hypothetical protein C3F09_12310 [candidate division GN15 bacterium]|uniref:Dockerin domain-containing protein n=1 Tax=candidate division GN15 bacterium TaxID=2072418 RepID=A0A855WVH9_9BACT|nr:MAG: hypothetical protein C3F09_12310 [candidate division GN15 bacterium]